MSGTPSEVREGGCRCGAVRYRVSAKPLWVTHCHCDDCRRSCGAAVATFVGVAAQDFTVVSGEPRIHRSSPQVRRSFCADCGTPLTYEADFCPNEVHVLIGTFDAPQDFKPGSHVFTKYQMPWLHMDDGLPEFERLPPGVEEAAGPE